MLGLPHMAVGIGTPGPGIFLRHETIFRSLFFRLTHVCQALRVLLSSEAFTLANRHHEPPPEPTEISMIPVPEARPDSEGCHPVEPLFCGYYWFPSPGPDGLQWSLVTCADLGLGPDQGHTEAGPKCSIGSPSPGKEGADLETLLERKVYRTSPRPRHEGEGIHDLPWR